MTYTASRLDIKEGSLCIWEREERVHESSERPCPDMIRAIIKVGAAACKKSIVSAPFSDISDAYGHCTQKSPDIDIGGAAVRHAVNIERQIDDVRGGIHERRFNHDLDESAVSPDVTPTTDSNDSTNNERCQCNVGRRR